MPETTDNPILTERFDSALRFAVDHHRSQLRKGGGIPYVAHLFAVAAVAMEIGDSEEEAIAALLHDAVEDGDDPGETATAIGDQFGGEVLRIVLANTDSTEPTDGRDAGDWKQRKEGYLAAIPDKRPDEVRVSIADKLHNARSILADLERHGDNLWERFNADREGVLWYYRSLVEAFEARRPDIGEAAASALTEFGRVVEAIRAEAA